MARDFAESVPAGDASGSFVSAYEWTVAALESESDCFLAADSRKLPMPLTTRCRTKQRLFGSPTHHITVSSSLFLLLALFLRLAEAVTGKSSPLLFAGNLTPKGMRSLRTTTRKTLRVSVRGLREANGRCVCRGPPRAPRRWDCSVVFAHKTTEGWEALLAGMIRGGWTRTGSWPIATELGMRLRVCIRLSSRPASTLSAVLALKRRGRRLGRHFEGTTKTCRRTG